MKQITEVYIYTCVDGDSEVVPALNMQGQMWPLMFTNLSSENMRSTIVREFKKQSGKKLTCYKFTNKEEIPL